MPEVVKELDAVTVNVFCVLLIIVNVSSIAFPVVISKKTESPGNNPWSDFVTTNEVPLCE